MSTILQLTPHDPLIARDGRPFGAGQGNRMRGLPWPLPSVVAGSFRTALVKAGMGDFSGDMPQRVMQIAVAGVLPTAGAKLYLPAPNDCVWDEKTDQIQRVRPIELQKDEGVDFPKEVEGLWPIRLTEKQAKEDFKAKSIPAWWPVERLTDWLTTKETSLSSNWFDNSFLGHPIQEIRDHVCLDPDRGAAAEGQIFATAGLNVTHLPRFYINGSEEEKQSKTCKNRVAEITLTARVTIPDTGFDHVNTLDIWHPLGGERRMVHWKKADSDLWACPEGINSAIRSTTEVRMVLATPAIFAKGWKPGWLTNGLQGELHGVKLRLVGVSNGRWKAVSGWSLAPPRGPKPIRRMVPAGSVYFFKCEKGAAAKLADLWLQPVSDDEQDRRDGFGLAVWGIW